MLPLGQLRNTTDNDLELIRSWRNAPEIASKMYTRHTISANEHRAWWLRVCASNDQAHFIYENAGIAFGVVNFTKIDRTNENCFWAFYANPSAPRGTGSCMEYLALEYAFTKLQLKKLSCEVLSFNESVIKLHKKFGFREEGVFRKHHKIGDQFVDVIRLGILDIEWIDAKKSVTSAFKET